MVGIQKIKEFVESLSESESDSDEILRKSNEFFSENCSEIDAEFIDRLLKNKAEGANIGIELMQDYFMDMHVFSFKKLD